jgi:hypothetical protein
MGWRGVLRSMAAASRAAERDRQRREQAVQRAHDQVDKTVDRFDQEVERDVAKIAAIEQKVLAKPLTASGIAYNPETQRWSFKEIVDNTGQLTWKLALEFSSDQVVADKAVADGPRAYELIAFAATRWASYAAFRVSISAVGPATRLFNKTNPANNRVFLTSTGTSHRAIEGQLDVDVPIPGSTIALVAFPPFKSAAVDLSIDFLLKGGTARMQLSAPSQTLFSHAAATPSLVERFRTKMSERVDDVHGQARNTKAKIEKLRNSGSGCLVVLLIVAVVWIVATIVKE